PGGDDLHLCPLSESKTIAAAYQPLQHGMLIWRSDNKKIIILFENDVKDIIDDSWQEGQPQPTPINGTPPVGFYQPVRGFGKVWSPLQLQLGWALQPEQGY